MSKLIQIGDSEYIGFEKNLSAHDITIINQTWYDIKTNSPALPREAKLKELVDKRLPELGLVGKYYNDGTFSVPLKEN